MTFCLCTIKKVIQYYEHSGTHRVRGGGGGIKKTLLTGVRFKRRQIKDTAVLLSLEENPSQRALLISSVWKLALDPGCKTAN